MALKIRNFDTTVHRRLINFPKLVYQVTPSVNPNFIADASLFRGIGWPEDPYDWTRQMALVSPRHLVFATHYTLTPTWQIIFVGNDGNQHLHGIESQTPIFNDQGQQTDLMLVTLATPVETELGITPFPVLNLANESDYIGKSLLVCGSFVESGSGVIQGFSTLKNDPGFDTTRFIGFDYNANNPNPKPHDCRLWYGDSGAPNFVMVNGQPAIVGTNSSFDDLTPNDQIDGPVFRNYLSSIPSYMPALDALMEVKGYHLKRFYPTTTAITISLSPNVPLRRLKPGSVSIISQNSGLQTAHNLALKLTFQAAPTTVAGSGWICEALTPTIWNCRKGGINANDSSALTATWSQLPNSPSLQITTVKTFDGNAPNSSTLVLPQQETYSSWSSNLTESATTADPDRDGISNLLEYALGGAPNSASYRSPQGWNLLPESETTAGQWTIHYPQRKDANLRGLSVILEFSTDLATWQNLLPPGTSSSVSPFTPIDADFEKVSVSMPISETQRFLRLKISLNE